MFAKVGDTTIGEENAVKLLDLITYLGLTFNKYVKVICKKESRNLTDILELANILSEYERYVVIKTCFESQFQYILLILMSYWVPLTGRTNDYTSEHYGLFTMTVILVLRNFRTRMGPLQYPNVILELSKCRRYQLVFDLHL